MPQPRSNRTSLLRTAPPGGALRAAAVVAALVSALAGSPASAALGGPAASVLVDRTALRADVVGTTETGAYQRHEFTTPDGTSVREFASPAGGVFAVDFSGPTMPDLKTVLGSHYGAYEAAATARRGAANHHVFSFANDGVVMTVTKLPRGLAGRAHLPAAVPAGVDVDALR